MLTYAQILETQKRLRNMISWLINQTSTNNFDDKARAVERYATQKYLNNSF